MRKKFNKSRKKSLRKSLKELFKKSLCRFSGTNTSDDVIENQRKYVLIYSLTGYLIGLVLNSFMVIMSHEVITAPIIAFHIVFLLTTILLYGFRVLSISSMLCILLSSMMLQLSSGTIYQACIYTTETSIPIILTNVVLMVMYFILAIMTHIRFLSIGMAVLTIGSMITCSIITGNRHMANTTILLSTGIIMLLFIGNRLKQDVSSLQQNKEERDREDAWFFGALNISKEEAFRILKLSQRKDLSSKQKEKLLNLLDENSRSTLLSVATELVQKKQQNLSTLDNRTLSLTSYEKEICLLIVQGMNSTEIAGKLKKNFSSITTTRAKIRRKLGLKTGDDLREELLRLVNDSPCDSPEKNSDKPEKNSDQPETNLPQE